MQFRKKIKSARISEIDFIRGVLILFMVVDHFFFDFMEIVPQFFSPYPIELYHLSSWWWSWDLRIGTRFAILALFFFVSGISCYFSRSNLKRGLLLSGVGIVISLGFMTFSKITDTNNYVFFGAISCFGLSILIYWLISFLFHKLTKNSQRDFKWIMLSLGLVIIPIGLMFNAWNIETVGPYPRVPLTIDNWFQIIIGIKQHNGVDWLPLFPYLGFMFVGSFFGEILYPKRRSLFLSYKMSNFHYSLKEKNKENYLVSCTFIYKSKKVVYLVNVPLKEKKYLAEAKKQIEELENKNQLAKYAYHYIHQHYDSRLSYILASPIRYIKNTFCFCGHFSLFIYIFHQVVLILFIFLILLACGFKLVL